ncbi:hypothetical protein K474DRAFT_1678648 [Panus rudis PR-1116 ss-1]|nr:hypothetical protein K474DRAFT_1678648 [Panus rudis PR-1116 ss-1]
MATTADTRTFLNFDVLSLILDSAKSSEDILPLVQASRLLYTTGAKALIRNTRFKVDLSDGRTLRVIESFCSFFEADNYARCALMQTLRVSTIGGMSHGQHSLRAGCSGTFPLISQDILRRLAEILRHCTALTSITLRNLAPQALASIPEIPQAIGTLSALRTFKLRGGCPGTREML